MTPQIAITSLALASGALLAAGSPAGAQGTAPGGTGDTGMAAPAAGREGVTRPKVEMPMHNESPAPGVGRGSAAPS